MLMAGHLRLPDVPPAPCLTLNGADEAGHLFLGLGRAHEKSVRELIGTVGKRQMPFFPLVGLDRNHQGVERGVVHLGHANKGGTERWGGGGRRGKRGGKEGTHFAMCLE